MTFPLKTLQQLRPLLIGFRKKAGLSQAAVAALLGVTQQSYAKIEANPSATSVERLFTILRLLGAEIILERSVLYQPADSSEEKAFHDEAQLATPSSVETSASATPRKILPPTMKRERW